MRNGTRGSLTGIARHTRTAVALGVIALLALTGCAPTAWNQHLASVATDALDVHETVLPNGLRLVVHEDHRVPVVKVITVVGVGSADEPAGRGGFAHLFEHLMFTGTTAAPQFDVTMEAVGGTNNAWTDYDQTVYYESAPAHALDTLLWLEADRFANLGASISQNKIDVQRDVVLNEMRQSVLDEPGGAAAEATGAALFAPGHPYRRPVIGSIADLRAATRADVVDFFTRFYTPSNMTLIIAGDVDATAVRRRVEALHGRIAPRRRSTVTPRRDLLTNSAARTGRSSAIRRCRPCRQRFVDAVSAPRISTTYVWPTHVVGGSFVDPALEAATSMANDAFISALQIDLVRERNVANWVSFSYQPLAHAQMLSIDAEAAEGVSGEQLRVEVDRALGDLIRDGFTDREMDAVRVAARGALAAQLEEPNGRADVLQEVITRNGSTGDVPGSIGSTALVRYGRRFQTVTATAATRRLRWVVQHAERLEQTILPGERGGYPAILTDSSGKPQGPLLSAPRPVTFNRPVTQKPSSVRVPDPTTATLHSGVPLAHFERPDAPTVELVVMVNGGGSRDPVGKEGRGSLMAQLMTRGVGTRDAVELSARLGELGSGIQVSGSADRYTVSVSSPPDSLDATLALLHDVLTAPRFDAAELELAKDETIASLESQQTEPGALAFYAGVRDYFEPGDPVTRFATISSISRIGADDLRAEHRVLFQPQNAEIVSGGPLPTADMAAKLDAALHGWMRTGPAITVPTRQPPQSRPMHTVLVDVPGASQAQILYFAAGPDPASPLIIAADSSAFVLGGAFTSRLNRSLREEKGYTYGASAGLSVGERYSLLQASTSVERSVTRPSVDELLRIIQGFDRGDVTAQETASATSATYASSVGLVSTNGALVSTYAGIRDLGLNWSEVGKRLRAAQSLDRTELSAGATALIDDRRVTLVIAGDLSVIKPQLANAPFAQFGTVSQATVDLH